MTGFAGTIRPAAGDYEVDRQRHLKARRRRLDAEVDKLTWPLARLERLRDRRREKLLAHARERSPWHARRLAGLATEPLDPAGWAEIPPMSKDDLMTHWDEIVTDRRLNLDLANAHLERISEEGPSYLFDEYHVIASGGSTGTRSVMVWGFEGFLHHHLAYARVALWRSRQARPSRRRRPTVVAMIYATNPVHISAALGLCFRSERYPVHLLSATDAIPRLVSELNRIQPTNVASYPSVLRILATQAKAGRLTIRPRRLTTNGETLGADTRAFVEEVFGVPIENSWGTSETAPLASSDGVNPGLVLHEDKTVIEPVDEHGRPVPPGRRAAKVLVTNLVNPVLPLIRFEITDEVTFVDGDNPGPWTGRLIEEIAGRTDEWFVYSDGVAVHPFLFRDVLGAEAAISEYQVLQTARGAEVLVCAEGAVDLAGVATRLEEALGASGLTEPKVTARRIERMERHRQTGKLRRFVPAP